MAPYPTHRFAGSNSDRQSVGLPGHCERCAEVGHVKAHPSFGCGDVGCTQAHSPTDEVPIGSVWADKDPRHTGRTFRVDRIQGDKAMCVNLTTRRVTRISLARFKPTSSGYRLVEG